MQHERPAAPVEPRHPTCCNGHDVDYKDELFACDRKACSHDELCIGCVWTCADCSGDFCEEHIYDLADVLGAPFTVFLCALCLAKRKAVAVPKMPAASATGNEVLAWLPTASAAEVAEFSRRLAKKEVA